MILIKIGEDYKLYSHDSCIATTHESPYKRLSKENCDEIFWNKPAIQEPLNEYIKARHTQEECVGFIDGFDKAIEIQKNKLFTEETIEDAFKGLRDCIQDQDIAEFYINLAKTIFCEINPNEIEVEIEMDDINKHNLSSFKGKPKLDENNCLILKKK
jgi:hypothetical protein